MKMSQYKKIVTACIAALSLLVQAGALAYAEEMIIDEGDPVVQEFPVEDAGDAEQGYEQGDASGYVDGEDDEVDFDALFEGDETITFENSGMTVEDVNQEEEVLPEEEVFLLRADHANVEYTLEKLLEVPDPIGSDGELEVGAFIKQTMLGLGYTVSEQAFHEGRLNENGIDPPGINIIAERGADAEERTNGILILCAHYDSKSFIDPEEMGDAPITALAAAELETEKYPRPVSFSDNDKSGAAVLLETARILAQEETGMDICFVFLSGEEDGYYGSKHFAEWLSDEQKSRVQGVICLGEMGVRTEDAPLYLLGTVDGEESLLTGIIRSCAEKLGYGNGLQQHTDNEEMLAEALAFAQNGLETEMTEQDETADGGQAENEAEFDETPANWSTALLPAGIHTAFAEIGLPAVSIFQDTEGSFRNIDGMVTEETEEEEAVTEGDTEAEAQTTGAENEAAAGTEENEAAAGTEENEAAAGTEENGAAAGAENETAAGTEIEADGMEAEPETEISDIYDLSQIADLMSETIFLYMQ